MYPSSAKDGGIQRTATQRVEQVGARRRAMFGQVLQDA
jgi:hypothetical protein